MKLCPEPKPTTDIYELAHSRSCRVCSGLKWWRKTIFSYLYHSLMSLSLKLVLVLKKSISSKVRDLWPFFVNRELLPWWRMEVEEALLSPFLGILALKKKNWCVALLWPLTVCCWSIKVKMDNLSSFQRMSK